MKRFKITKDSNTIEQFNSITECIDYLLSVDYLYEDLYVEDKILEVEVDAEELIITFDEYENMNDFSVFE